jgi:hypothetical protein
MIFTAEEQKGTDMALPRRLQLEEKIRQESEAFMNRWLLIGFLGLAFVEVAVNLARSFR